MSGVIALIVAVAGLLGAVAGIIGLFRKVAAVHVLVNSQLTATMQRVEQLTGVLRDAGLAVPDRPGEAGERLAGAENKPLG